jgi:sugar transferase EpsL
LGLLTLPLVGVLAMLVRLKLGRPVLFRQQRAGLGGVPFTLWKLRTMTERRDEAGRPLPDEDRLGDFGRWLRSTSLDELPELWNVIRGEMSLVGPRPLPLSYLTRYTPEEARRHNVRPGLTGWAQINGRNTTSWDERLAMDVWYVDSRSFELDVRILVQTLLTVLRRSGVSAENHATMPELRPDSHP